MSDKERLKRELQTYHRHERQLTPGNEGRYALVHGDDAPEVWDTYEDALRAGYERFGLEPFLVKEIHGVATIPFLSPDVEPCQS